MPQIPSFIPRRPLSSSGDSLKKSLPVGLLSIVGGGVVVITLLFSASTFALRTFQEQQIEALRDRLAALIDELDLPTVRAMDTFDKKLALIASLLDEHTHTSKIFTFLSQTTLKDVRFSSFAFFAKERTVTLAAEARGYSALIKQINLFRAQPSIEHIDAGSVSLGPAGTVRTTITIKVAPSLLRL